jgi:hypothetical protein
MGPEFRRVQKMVLPLQQVFTSIALSKIRENFTEFQNRRSLTVEALAQPRDRYTIAPVVPRQIRATPAPWETLFQGSSHANPLE